MLVLGMVAALAYLAVALAAAAVLLRGGVETGFQADDGLPPVAVVVAVRNEENTVASCLRALAGAASELGYPITAMGNNMAFGRAAYNAVGGYRRFSSSPTEDYRLFKAFGARSRGAARLVLNRELVVIMEPVATLRQAFSQRRRWARGGLHTSAIGYLIYIVAWSAHALPLVLLPVAPPAALICFVFKVAADAAVLAACGKRLRHPPPWDAFVGFEIFLTGYVVLMPLSLILMRRHTWKGRAISGYGISGAGES